MLYEKHWDKVYSQSFKKLNDPDLAKDITQDVFVYLWLHLEGNHIENLQAYLFSAVRNNVFRAYDLLIQCMPQRSKRFSGWGIMKIFLRWRLQKS